MRKQTRRVLFYVLVFVFAVATPFIILYALGYVPDIGSWRLTPTGGVFVKANESGVTVRINGRIEKETGFIARSALVANLPLGVLSAEVTKTGFHPWKKNIEIEKEIVQEFPFILLIPETLNSVIISGTTTPQKMATSPLAVLPNPNGDRIIWVTVTGRRTDLHVVNRSLGDDSRPVISLADGDQYLSAAWNQEGDEFIFSAAKNGTRWYYANATDGKPELLFDPQRTVSVARSATSTVADPLRLKLSNIKEVVWDPSASGKLLLFDGDKLYRWSRKESLAQPLAENIPAFAAFTDKLYFINQTGFFGSARPDGSNIELFDRPGFFIDDTKSPQIIGSPNGTILAIDSSGGIYALDKESDRLTPATENAGPVKFSRSRNLAGYIEGGKLAVRFFENETRQPFREKNLNYPIIDAVVPVNNFIWFDNESAHLIFTTDDGVFITETDNRFGANTTTLKTGQFLIAEDPSDANSFFLTDGQTLERVTID